MYRVIYRSYALVDEYTPAALSILAAAERRNRLDGISGFLHREANWFVQVIEGDEAPVNALLERLERDDRHAGMTILTHQTVPHRAFSSWDMGYASNHKVKLADHLPEIWGRMPLSHDSTDRLIVFLQDLARLKSKAAA